MIGTLRNVNLNVISLHWIFHSPACWRAGLAFRWCWGRFVHVSKCCRCFIVSNWFIDIPLILYNCSPLTKFLYFYMAKLRHEIENKTKFAFAHSKNWIFALNWAAFATRICWCLEKDNNNHCNYLQRRKNLLLFIWLWGQICVSLNCDLWRCVECSRSFRRRYKQQNVPRHFCASCHFLSSIVKKICSIVKRLRS